jgi:hypothetical protein
MLVYIQVQRYILPAEDNQQTSEVCSYLLISQVSDFVT